MRCLYWFIGLVVVSFVAVSVAQDAVSAPTVKVTHNDTYGDILTDGGGKSLYIFLNDKVNGQETANPTCVDTCAQNWPPFLATGQPVAANGAAPSLVGTVDRLDGTKQVTYYGYPLYYYAKDQASGDTTGEGLNDSWYLVSVYGTAVKPAPAAPAAPAPASSTAAATPAELISQGAEIFAGDCAVCHGANGQGDIGPSFVGNTVLNNHQLIISQVLRGGQTMPAFGSQLSDVQVASVLSYIMNTWGNDYGTITPQEVTPSRQ